MPVNLPRRQVILLAALLGVFAVVLAYQFRGRPGRGVTTPGAPQKAGAGQASGDASLATVPDVKLAELKGARPEPVGTRRNLFREQAKAPAEPPRAAGGFTVGRPNATPRPPPGPPPPPPITLKFIGVVHVSGQAVAVFRSEGGDVLYGREGELLEGQYRVIRIGVESVDVSYADGRGRQRIPLSG